MPVISVVATFTLRAEASVVYVVSGVTAAAGLRGVEFGFHRPAVAVNALCFFMRAIQLEFGAIMVEIP